MLFAPHVQYCGASAVVDIMDIVKDEEILKEYGKYAFPSDTLDFLNDFLNARKLYLSNPSMDNRIQLKRAFNEIYHETKYAHHLKIIKESDFVRLTDMLRKGV